MFQRSDGVRLEFRPLVDEDLPPFVLDRYLQSGVFNPFAKSQVRVRLRLETPVTYFYTNRERDVNVRVRFPHGLLTEFYPPVARMEPSFASGEGALVSRLLNGKTDCLQPGEAAGDFDSGASLLEDGFVSRQTVSSSSLDWGRIHLIPTDRLRADVADPARRRLLESLLPVGLLPASQPKFHYGRARQTDSALVHVHRPKPDETFPLAPAGDFFEKFLFYRGVGNFELPLTLTAASDGTFELANSGDGPIRSLFLVDVDGEAVRFAAFEQIAPGGRMKLVQRDEPTTIDSLADAVKIALVAEGLYEKEAIAMVETWRSSWFGETGTRLLYIVPRPITDALLPLDVTPTPEETVRVLVGRMEIMTPAEESRIAAMVARSAAERRAEFEAAMSEGRAANYAGPAELATLGRLAEPALARVWAISKDPATRAEARLLLQSMLPK